MNCCLKSLTVLIVPDFFVISTIHSTIAIFHVLSIDVCGTSEPLMWFFDKFNCLLLFISLCGFSRQWTNFDLSSHERMDPLRGNNSLWVRVHFYIFLVCVFFITLVSSIDHKYLCCFKVDWLVTNPDRLCLFPEGNIPLFL